MGKRNKQLCWDDLKLVKAIAQTGGHAAKAAALSGVDPSTISRRVKQLEEALGVALFERHRRGYSLTDSGAEIAALTERVSADILAVSLKLGEASRPTGELRVTTNDSILVHLLSPLVTRFNDRYPEVQLNLGADNLPLNLSNHVADVALRATDKPPEALVGRRIARIAWALYGRTGALRPGETADIAWLSRKRWVTLGGNLSNLNAAKLVKSQASADQIALTVNSVQGLADSIEKGVGIGYLPCFVGDQMPLLMRLGSIAADLGADLWVLNHPDLRRAPRVRAFVDFVVPELVKKRKLLEGT